MLYLLILVFVVLYVVVSIAAVKWPHLFLDAQAQKVDGKTVRGNTLLVIAHPDDESMFFGPTIISLQNQNRGRDKLHIMCLSDGGHMGQSGQVRSEEFFAAVRVFGITPANVILTITASLKDGSDWDEALISDIIRSYCDKHSIRNIVTFDEYGVSGHKNHISIFNAAKTLPRISLFALESVPLLRKYFSLLDIPLTLLIAHVWPSRPWTQLITPHDRRVVLSALYQHQSQMVWFRRLYSLFSRYLFINTFQVYK